MALSFCLISSKYIKVQVCGRCAKELHHSACPWTILKCVCRGIIGYSRRQISEYPWLLKAGGGNINNCRMPPDSKNNLRRDQSWFDKLLALFVFLVDCAKLAEAACGTARSQNRPHPHQLLRPQPRRRGHGSRGCEER